MKNYVILPTYKEAENLKDLLPLLRTYKVIVVDDNSEDGTVNICGHFKNVKLITRKNERGLASAVLDGIKSIKDKDAKIVVMDADFQHDPKKLPEFFKKLDKNYFVYGIRKNSNMSVARKLISKSASLIAKILVNGIKNINDPMSGYFGFRLAYVDLRKIQPKGYKIMLDIFANLKYKDKIAAVEYNFGERKAGKSKLGGTTIIEFISQILKLNNYRILKFALVGFIGVFVNEFIAFLLHHFLPLYIVFTLSAESAIISNFILNHEFTFKKRVSFLIALPRYNAVALLGLLINVVIATYLSLSIEYLIANFIGIIIAFIFNYTLSEKFAWSSYV